MASNEPNINVDIQVKILQVKKLEFTLLQKGDVHSEQYKYIDV